MFLIMSRIRYIIFDFDGTIADTIDLALAIYNRIAPEYNCKPVNDEDRKVLREGKPKELLKEYGVTNLKLGLLLLRIRKEIGNHIPELKLVKGIRDPLREIKNAGLILGILTSNSTHNVNRFLKKNDLTDIFDFVYSGKSLFGKDRVLMRLFDHEKISGEEVMYIGDETRDIEASERAGIPVVAVTWGLNNRKALLSLKPDQIADKPADLPGCVQEVLLKN